jgi:regulator of sigma E protease
MWRIGVGFRSNVVVQQLPWGKAITASLRDNLRNSLATFEVLRKILTRRMSARSLSGPIGIAQLSGEMYRAGITELLMFVSFISLQLSIFNLLPIPILDGGVIFLLLIEGLMRRDLSLEVKERFAQVGIVFLLLLAVFVVYNDILKTFRPY